MIASLRGKIASKKPPAAIVEVSGVGYEVMMPESAFSVLPVAGEEILVHVALVVRDDSHTLYGFLTAEERFVFKALTRISGVGSKSALALLSEFDTSSFASAVEAGDVQALSRASGIGRKTAERILVELRGSDMLAFAPAVVPVVGRAVEALTALGFSAAQARGALSGMSTSGLSVPDLVKAALKDITTAVRKF